MTKQQVLEEALNLFAHHGYENTSLAHIAKAVGIKKPSLYNHFSNKEAIFFEVLDEVVKRQIQFFEQKGSELNQDSIEDQLHDFYDIYLDYMTTSTEGMFFKRVTFFPPENFSDEIKKAFLRVEDTLTNSLIPVFEKGIEEGKLRKLPVPMLTSAFYTLIDGLFLEENFYDTDILNERKKASWEIFWLGIRHPEEA
ncbi:TetR/AcrR family transcriptional regulator [Halobacillus fulvus]|nr:TetR/AcrR family transcriptional regulator [Halobacillus fulvus]